jgi:hypothetical protein
MLLSVYRNDNLTVDLKHRRHAPSVSPGLGPYQCIALRMHSYGRAVPRREIPDEYGTPVALAIGHAVIAAAALEKVQLGEIGRRQLEADGQPTQSLTRTLTELESQPAGRLLRKLREQGMADDLAERIDNVLTRRNRMVHGMIEDLAVATALVTGDGIEEVLSWIAKIEADCGALIAELQPLAYASLEVRVDESNRIRPVARAAGSNAHS